MFSFDSESSNVTSVESWVEKHNHNHHISILLDELYFGIIKHVSQPYTTLPTIAWNFQPSSWWNLRDETLGKI